MVRCKDCGFLAYRKNSTRELGEVDQALRDSGRLPKQPFEASGPAFKATAGLMQSSPLICAVGATDLCAEHMERKAEERLRLETTVTKEERTRIAVYETERDCAKFTPYVQGFSPKEHVQIFLLGRQRDEIEERRHSEIVRVTMRAAIVGAVVAAVGSLLCVGFGAWLATPTSPSAVTAGE